MSKKKKRTGGNPAKKPMLQGKVETQAPRRCAYCGYKTHVQPEQRSTEQARLPHHPRPNQTWVPMCEEGRKMRGILHRIRQEAA
jgi:hypothetical protein